MPDLAEQGHLEHPGDVRAGRGPGAPARPGAPPAHLRRAAARRPGPRRPRRRPCSRPRAPRGRTARAARERAPVLGERRARPSRGRGRRRPPPRRRAGRRPGRSGRRARTAGTPRRGAAAPTRSSLAARRPSRPPRSAQVMPSVGLPPEQPAEPGSPRVEVDQQRGLLRRPAGQGGRGDAGPHPTGPTGHRHHPALARSVEVGQQRREPTAVVGQRQDRDRTGVQGPSEDAVRHGRVREHEHRARRAGAGRRRSSRWSTSTSIIAGRTGPVGARRASSPPAVPPAPPRSGRPHRRRRPAGGRARRGASSPVSSTRSGTSGADAVPRRSGPVAPVRTAAPGPRVDRGNGVVMARLCPLPSAGPGRPDLDLGMRRWIRPPGEENRRATRKGAGSWPGGIARSPVAGPGGDRPGPNPAMGGSLGDRVVSVLRARVFVFRSVTATAGRVAQTSESEAYFDYR